MKILLKSTLVLSLLMLSLGMVSCDPEKDKPDPGTPTKNDYAAAVSGTYVGQDDGSDVTKGALQTKAIGATVTITRESNNKVTIAYDNDGVTKSSITSYQSATVTKRDNGEYNINYDDKYIDMQIRGIVNGSSLTLQRINYGDVEVNFSGNKQ